jgi:AraC family transcriptional regulator
MLTKNRIEGAVIMSKNTSETSQVVSSLEPRFEDGKPLLIAGLMERYSGTEADFPAQWQRFAPYIGHIPGQVGEAAYGVISAVPGGGGGFDYLSGVEVFGFAALPDEFSRLHIPARRYVVFEHRGHVSAIRNTMAAIWNEWLPQSGYEVAESAEFFERYGEEFDPRTGLGVVEIWIPLKA